MLHELPFLAFKSVINLDRLSLGAWRRGMICSEARYFCFNRSQSYMVARASTARAARSASSDGTMASSLSSAPSASVAELQQTQRRTPCGSLFHDPRFHDSYSAGWGPLLPSIPNPLFRTFDTTGLRRPAKVKNKQEALQQRHLCSLSRKQAFH